MDDLVAVSLSEFAVRYVDTDGRERRDGLREAASVARPTVFHRLWPGRSPAGPTLPLADSPPVCAG